MELFNHCFVNAPKLVKVDRRYVTPEGHSYESVTSYIDRLMPKPQLEAWRKKHGAIKAQAITTAAAKRGTSLHKACQTYLMNEELNLNDSPNTKSLFLKVKPLVDRLDNIRLIETPIYSDELKLGGTPDCIADWDSELAVADFKSSTKVKKKSWIMGYYLQCGAYGMIYNERFHQMPKKAVIIFGVPDQANGIVQEMPMEQCVEWFRMFRIDPVTFCAQLEAYKEKHK
jgi:hypothetical protein